MGVRLRVDLRFGREKKKGQGLKFENCFLFAGFLFLFRVSLQNSRPANIMNVCQFCKGHVNMCAFKAYDRNASTFFLGSTILGNVKVKVE